MSRYLVVVGILALFCGYVFFLSSMRGKNLSTLFKTPVVWGAYTGNTDQSMATFESFVGGHMSIDAVFWGWDSDFPTTTAGTLGKTLVIFWEPSSI